MRREGSVAWLLWDIDGTLVQLRKSPRNRHAEALQPIVGKVEARGLAAGMTDREVLRVMLESSGITPRTDLLDSALLQLDVIAERDARGQSLEPLPGVPHALRAVRALGWSSGLLTGNTPARARLKVEAAGLWPHFQSGPGFYGDRLESRTALVKGAVASARASDVQRIVIVGDTVRDVEAAKAGGVLAVGVATGGSSVEELVEAGADLVIRDLVAGLDALSALLAAESVPETESPGPSR
jgi:phosphoglycolate phosphatase